jgi:hypothetical protein
MYIETEAAIPTPLLKHKHVRLDQRKLNRAKKALRAQTETETIDRALDLILAEDAIDVGLRQYGGKATLEKVFR